MQMDLSHPAIRLAQHLVGDEGWEVTDMLERDGEAALVELRHLEERQTVLLVAKDGEWVRPGLVSTNRQAIPGRVLTTVGHTPFEQSGTRATGWPDPEGGRPTFFWMTVDGFAAEDAETVEVSTELDRHVAAIKPDGSFLTLVRARHRERPRIRLRMVTGDYMDASL